MATHIQVECPHCSATFKLNSRAPLGKAVSCPRCEQSFVAREKPLEPEYEESPLAPVIVEERPAAPKRPRKPTRPRPPAPANAIEDYGDPEDLAPRSQSPRSRRPSSRNGWKWPLIIGGSAIVLLVLVGLVWLFVGKLFAKKLDLAWLPEDAFQISVVRYSDLWSSSIVQDSLNSQVKDDIRKMKTEWGIEPKDIESVTTAYAARDRIIVLRSHVDLDEDKIVGNAGRSEKKTYDGETYYRVGDKNRLITAIYFPDDRTAISGSEDAVKRAIDRGPKAEPREELDFIDGDFHALTIFVRRGKTIELPNVRIPVHKIRVNATSQRITSSIKTVWKVKFDSAEEAAEYEESIKDQAERFGGPFGGFARAAADRSFSRSGDVVTSSVTVTPRTVFGVKLFAPGLMNVPSIATVAKNPAGQLFGMTWYSSMKLSMAKRHVVEIELRQFRGNGNLEDAARNAVHGLAGLDTERTRFSGTRMTVYFDYHQRVNTREVLRRLREEGFMNASVMNVNVRTLK